MTMAQAAGHTTPAEAARLAALAARLQERNFDVLIVDDAAGAKAAVLAMLPEGCEVHTGKSKTLEDAGITGELMGSARHDFLRSRTRRMDYQTQGREIRKLNAAPDFMLGSVQAVTEAGQLVAASASGSQLGPYAFGAGRLILVAGSQKIVPDLDAALRRIDEHVKPYEEERLQAQMGVSTMVAKILVIEREFTPGRTTVVLVREPIGV